MTDSISEQMKDFPPDAATAYRDSMKSFAMEMGDINEYAITISNKTKLIIRIVSIMAIVSTIYLLYTVTILGDDMKRLAGNMVEMYQHFGTMSEDVNSMTVSVVDMGKTMNGLPSIASNMGSMNLTLKNMTSSVGGMDTTIQNMDVYMGDITGNMQNISNRMGLMTQSVDFMRYNVGEMSKSIP